jgi:hypothetical protein
MLCRHEAARVVGQLAREDRPQRTVMTVRRMTDEMFDAMVRIYEDQLPDVRSDAWRTEFARWELTAVCLGDTIAAVIGTLGNEIHIGVDPIRRRHWFPFKAFRRRVNELIDIYGAVTTIDLKDGGKSHEFIRRLGFVVDREDTVLVRYVLRGPYVHVDATRRRCRVGMLPSAELP